MPFTSLQMPCHSRPGLLHSTWLLLSCAMRMVTMAFHDRLLKIFKDEKRL